MNCIIGLRRNGGGDKNFSRRQASSGREPFDIWGSLALLIGYPALLIGLTFGANLGWTSRCGRRLVCRRPRSALASFVWIELRTAKPLIDVAIFRRKMLAAALSRSL